jgi:hypothetical protein
MIHLLESNYLIHVPCGSLQGKEEQLVRGKYDMEGGISNKSSLLLPGKSTNEPGAHCW